MKVGTATFSLETTIGGKIATVTVNVVDENATTYTLTYNANGGNGAPSAQSGAASYTVSSVKPVRSGYTFLGWSKSSSATSASYVAGNTITLSANTTLYAVWQKNNTTPFKAVCPNCEEVFTDEVQYSEHAKTCQIITCEKCGEKITVGSAYEEHMASCGNNEESGGILESIWSFIQAIINFILLPIRIFF
ncbi:MAG: InlB B-repeat-containing protein [Clostridia bacterium]|nr:InlB B-repeat-containing protein [Clostridia bacterium]